MVVNSDSRLDGTDHRGVYLKTPADIRAACHAIQSTWTPDEEMRRGGANSPGDVVYDRPARVHVD